MIKKIRQIKKARPKSRFFNIFVCDYFADVVSVFYNLIILNQLSKN